MPPENERTHIKNYIEDFTKKIASVQFETQHSIDLLKEHRAALITAAVTGQIPIEVMSK